MLLTIMNDSTNKQVSSSPVQTRVPMVTFEKVGLKFKKHSSLFELFFNKDREQDFWALKEVSFTLHEGETLGIVGRNGSGKSTLSLVCTKIYQPDRGKVSVSGKVQLLALGVGFQKQLTGRENIYISASLLGLKRPEINAQMEDIEAFADIGRFIDEPVRTYSNGMRSRLAFGIATAIHPDILILDEVMATGDNSFRDKAMERMKNLHSMAKCAIVVSHSPEQLEQLCNKVLWLEKGRIVMQGKPDKVLDAYQDFCKAPGKWMRQHSKLFFDLDLDDLKTSGYFLYHAPRYDVLMKLIHRYYKPGAQILEIGRTRFSKMVYNFFGVNVDGLGFEEDRKTLTGCNYHFDLNDAQNHKKWRTDLTQYDIILFAEVIEHLRIEPIPVMNFLKTILADDGIIILQTPNGAALHKKLPLPFIKKNEPLIPENSEDPGHFREYTAREIKDYCQRTGFEVISMTFENYFDYRYIDHANQRLSKKNRYWLVNVLFSILPESMRPGMCFTLRKAQRAKNQ